MGGWVGEWVGGWWTLHPVPLVESRDHYVFIIYGDSR